LLFLISFYDCIKHWAAKKFQPDGGLELFLDCDASVETPGAFRHLFVLSNVDTLCDTNRSSLVFFCDGGLWGSTPKIKPFGLDVVNGRRLTMWWWFTTKAACDEPDLGWPIIFCIWPEMARAISHCWGLMAIVLDYGWLDGVRSG